MTWVLLAVAYLLGAVPSSYVAGRVARGVDLRTQGSGNLGATNAFRVLGWRVALPVLLFDIFKGWFPAYAFPLWDGAPSPWWALAYGAAAVLGHVFSPYVTFKGGKGVATSAGFLLALAPLAVGIGFIVWLIIVFSTKIVSIASLVAAATVPVTVYFGYGAGPILWLCLGMVAFVIFAHRANIRRLMRGEENRFGRRPPEDTLPPMGGPGAPASDDREVRP